MLYHNKEDHRGQITQVSTDIKEERVFFSIGYPIGNGPILKACEFNVEIKDCHDIIRGLKGRQFVLDGSERFVYLCDYGDHSINKIDVFNLTNTNKIRVSSPPYKVILDEISATMLVLLNNGTIERYDMESLERMDYLLQDQPEVGDFILSSNRDYLLITNRFNSTVKKVFTENLALKKSIKYGGSTWCIINRNGTNLVSDFHDGKILLIRESDLTPMGKIDVEFGIRRITSDHYRDLIYAGGFFTGNLYVFDSHYNLLDVIFVGKRIRDIRVTPRSGRVLAASSLGIVEVKVGKNDYGETDF